MSAAGQAAVLPARNPNSSFRYADESIDTQQYLQVLLIIACLCAFEPNQCGVESSCEYSLLTPQKYRLDGPRLPVGASPRGSHAAQRPAADFGGNFEQSQRLVWNDGACLNC